MKNISSNKDMFTLAKYFIIFFFISTALNKKNYFRLYTLGIKIKIGEKDYPSLYNF